MTQEEKNFWQNKLKLFGILHGFDENWQMQRQFTCFYCAFYEAGSCDYSYSVPQGKDNLLLYQPKSGTITDSWNDRDYTCVEFIRSPKKA